MNSYTFRAIVIGMMAVTVLLGAGCDDLNTGLVKRGYSYLVHNPLRWTNPADRYANIDPVDPIPTDAIDPKVAMNGKGDAIIIWLQKNTIGTLNVHKTEYRNGVWDSPVSIYDGGAGHDAGDHTVAIADDGTALIAWVQYHMTPGYDVALWQMYRNGSWGPLGAVTSTQTTTVAAAVHGAGTAYIVTANNIGGLDVIYRSDITDGINTYNEQISDGTSGTWSYNPAVAVDRQGNAVIVWAQGYASENRIYMSEYRGASWSDPGTMADGHIDFDNDDLTNSYSPQVAMSDSGSAIITWRQDDSAGMPHIFYSLYNSTGWDHPASAGDNRLDQAGLGEYGGTDPQVAMDSKGNAVAVWTRQIGGWSKIQKAELRNGTWILPGLLEHIDPAGTASTNPRVAMGGDDAVIAWRQLSLGWYHMYKAECRHGSWRYPKDLLLDRLDPEGATDVRTLSAAMNPVGEAIIVWDQIYSAPNRHVYKSECRPYREILPFLY
ncbi:MAG TPA: hypothetical protein PKX40_15980 [Spirochaetota bacterium]|mgnify:FL=1|nr:hypothetical protein [Spirochaetota bacterium]